MSENPVVRHRMDGSCGFFDLADDLGAGAGERRSISSDAYVGGDADFACGQEDIRG